MPMGAAKDAELITSGGSLCRNQKFATLPYIEGQKYTFGDTFTSREEQGEFIFWFGGKQGGNNPGLEEGVKKRANNVCEIVCNDNKFWLIPSGDWKEGDTRTYADTLFLNGVSIDKKVKQKLKFGDELTVIRTIEEVDPSNSVPNQTRIRYSGISLILKEREFFSELDVREELYRKRKKRKMENKVDLFYPGKNSLILSKILSFLDTNQLKSVRFISNTWNQEAMKILRKRTFANFRLCPLFWTNYSGQTHAFSGFYATPFLQYNHEMKQNPLMNWDILLPHFSTSTGKLMEINRTEGEPGAKLPLIASFPRVQSFHLICPCFPLSICFLKELDYKFRNLEEITLNYVFRTGLELLCKLDKPLRKLALINPYEPDFNSETIQLWEKLIQKHSTTLISLDFTMPICAAPHNGRVLHLPTFPVLKSLAVDYNIDFDYLEVMEDSRVKLPVQFHSEDPGISWLIYARHFPSLQSLKLTPMDILEQYEVCNKIFFPHGAAIPEQICKTLTNLDIPKEMRSRRLAVMFPNVYNAWINEDRQPAEVANTVNDKVDFLKRFHPLTDGQPTWELLPSLLPSRYDTNVISSPQKCDNNSSVETSESDNDTGT